MTGEHKLPVLAADILYDRFRNVIEDDKPFIAVLDMRAGDDEHRSLQTRHLSLPIPSADGRRLRRYDRFRGDVQSRYRFEHETG